MITSAQARRAALPIAALLSLVVCGPGCGEKPRESASKKPAEHVPTAPEIRGHFEGALQPVFAIVDSCGADTRVPAEVAAQVQAQIDDGKSKYSSQPAYKDGIRKVVERLEDSLRIVRDRQNGVLALYLCSIIRSFDPKNSRVVRFEVWGETVKNRPVVTINGWYEPRDTSVRTMYAFLDVYLPETGKTQHIEVREGEEFLDLKFVRIIGNRQGILFEYTKTNDRFEVYSPSWLRRQ